MTARIRFPGLLLACFLLAGASLQAQDPDQDLYWILDRTETARSENIPYFTVTDNSIVYRNEHHGSIEVQEPYSHYTKHSAEVEISERWSVPSRIPYLKEEQAQIGWTFDSKPIFDSAIDQVLMDIPSPWEISVLMYTEMGVDRSTIVYQPYWEYETVTLGGACTSKGTSGTFSLKVGADPSSMKHYLPDGSWTLVIEVHSVAKSTSGFGSSDYYAGTNYKNYFSVTTRYYYRFSGQAFVEVENVKPASKERGDDDGADIPWEIFLIPPGAYIGWRVLKNRNKKKKEEEEEEEEEKDDDEEEEEEEEERVSTYRMVIWKDFEDTLVLDDAPVKVGARIEEITPDGDVIDRGDLAKYITISGTIHSKVHSQKQEGLYMMGMVTAEREEDGSCPDMARVSFALRGPGGRFINHIDFKVDDAATIFVEPSITFAAGQGKTLFMEFYLYGAASYPEGLEVTLDEAGYEHFSAELEQSDDDPDLFHINLTESGDDKALAGTIETYHCTIRVTPRRNRPEVTESFVINRIHLGFRVEMRALKGYLVELESTPDHDILPKRGSKRRKKPAESRIDMQLVVVDDLHDNKIGPVGIDELDKAPEFKFEDDFTNSTLFVDKPEGANYVPTAGDLYQYEDLFFRDPTGENVQSPCELLKFKYEYVGKMPDGSFWGVIRLTRGFLVPPNRLHAKVTVKVTWHGQEFKEELVVPLNSQPYRDVEIPPGSDPIRAYNKYEDEDLTRKGNLIDLRRKICLDARFAELRPLFYKITVMIEGHDKVFGFDDADYENIMEIFKKYCSGEIGTYFAVKQTVSPDDENFDAAIATIAAMDKSIPVIICRIGLGIVTGGASEIILTPISALAEMKEYVDKGGDSVWGGFAQISIKLIAMELLFAGVGKGFSKFKQWRADRATKLQKLTAQTKKIGEGTKKVMEKTRINKALGNRPAYSSAPKADKIGKAASKTKQIVDRSKDMADDAIRDVRRNSETLFTAKDKFAEECSKVAREDGQKIVNEFKRVMNNPTATKEEMRKATLALQGNKSAQNILRSQPSDLLRANYNAQMKQIYEELDPQVIKRLQDKIKANSLTGKAPEIRVFKGATGNDSKALDWGRKIGADRDVTYQFKGSDGKWYDLNEDLMKDAYGEVFNEMQYKFIPFQRNEMLKTLTKADQALVNGKFGLDSYGDDLARIIDPTKAAEKLGDPKRVAETYIYKCKEWMKQGDDAINQAKRLLEEGFKEEAMKVQGYGQALIEEGIRQNVKQFKRILTPRIEAALVKGLSKDYTKLMAKMRVLESIGVPPPPGVIPITLEEARVVLKVRFGTTLEQLVDECGQAVLDVNAAL